MIQEKFDELVDLMDQMAPDVAKVEDNSNRAAGKRVRKLLQEVKVGAQELRVQIIDETRKG